MRDVLSQGRFAHSNRKPRVGARHAAPSGRRLRRVASTISGTACRAPTAVFALVAVCCLLVGCGEPRLAASNEPSPRAGAAAASPPPMAVASPVPSLGEVVWATSADPFTNAPRDEVTSLAPDTPRIAAFVLTGALPAGSIVQADWDYNDTSLDSFTRRIVLPAATDGAWLSFHIDRDESETWPTGVYAITISLNGQAARKAEIEVVAPA